jgi:hypothetical protein
MAEARRPSVAVDSAARKARPAERFGPDVQLIARRLYGMSPPEDF